MQVKSAYQKKLLDPRWQRLRLKALDHSHFSCDICGNDEETLHVHHKEYIRGREPWDYSIDQLAVLCASCHSASHEEEDFLSFVCSFAAIDGPGSRDECAALLAGYLGLELSEKHSYPAFEILHDAGALTEKILKEAIIKKANSLRKS